MTWHPPFGTPRLSKPTSRMIRLHYFRVISAVLLVAVLLMLAAKTGAAMHAARQHSTVAICEVNEESVGQRITIEFVAIILPREVDENEHSVPCETMMQATLGGKLVSSVMLRGPPPSGV